MSDGNKPLSTVSVVDLEAGRRLVAVSLDLRDDFGPMVRRTIKRLSELVQAGDDVVVVLDAAAFRPCDAGEFCRWLWDDAKALLRSVSWSPVTVAGVGPDLPVPAVGGPFGLGAFEVWSHGYGPESEEHRRRRFPPTLRDVVRRQLVEAEPGRITPDTLKSTRVAPIVRRLVQRARQASQNDTVVVVADAMDARGREILSDQAVVSGDELVRRGGGVICGGWLPRPEAVRLAAAFDLEVGRPAAVSAHGMDATFVAAGVAWLDLGHLTFVHHSAR